MTGADDDLLDPDMEFEPIPDLIEDDSRVDDQPYDQDPVDDDAPLVDPSSGGGLYPGMPCWCDGDVPDDLDFEPVDPASLPVDAAADSIFGDPEDDTEFWMYQGSGNGTSAPTSVAMMLGDVLGVPVASDEVIERAVELGVMSHDPSKEGLEAWSGMNDAGILVLAESFGLDVNLRYGDTEDLANYLAEGHSISVGLDAHEIWTGEDDADDGGVGGNHQVVVTGIDIENGLVYLNDSGTPDGQGEVIPLAQFEDAWADCNNSMIVTDRPGGEAAAGVDIDELAGGTPEGTAPYEGIIPLDANFFIDPPAAGADPEATPDPEPLPELEISLDRIAIEDPVPAADGLAQMLILPFTFLVRFADQVL